MRIIIFICTEFLFGDLSEAEANLSRAEPWFSMRVSSRFLAHLFWSIYGLDARSFPNSRLSEQRNQQLRSSDSSGSEPSIQWLDYDIGQNTWVLKCSELCKSSFQLCSFLASVEITKQTDKAIAVKYKQICNPKHFCASSRKKLLDISSNTFWILFNPTKLWI